MNLDNKLIEEMNTKRMTAEEFAVKILRKAILNGNFKDGEPIEIAQLEKKLGVSRMPIRLALQQLENEGLVLRNPHKKPIAVKLSVEEVMKICDIRCELESLAVRRSAPKLTPEHFQRLKELVEKMDQVNEPDAFLELNEQFHRYLYKVGGNEILDDLIAKFRNNVQRYLRVYLLNFRTFKQGNRDHREIVSALEAGDVEQAVHIIRQHIVRISNNVVKILDPEKASKS